jgi:Uncharacterized protein conserved in bacteria (DUF2325)
MIDRMTTQAIALGKFARRKLWHLPANCSDLLVMSSHSIESMRLLAQKGLSKVGGGPCRLTGRDADLLYSVTRDFGTRNPLSEIFQRDFEARHKSAIARLSSVKTSDELAMVWTQLLDSKCSINEVGSSFWAMLTHPCGVDIEGGIIYEMDAWVLTQMRSCASHKRQQNVQAQLMVDLQTQTEIGQERLRQAQAQLEIERNESLRLRCEINGLMQRLGEREPEAKAKRSLVRITENTHIAPSVKNKSPSPRGFSWVEKSKRIKENTERFVSTQTLVEPKAISENKAAVTPINISGKRILCVGGLTGSQPLYRQVVEKAGGQCQFHDGGLEDSVQRLPVLIESVDVVICQAGCINHEAYQHVKRSCNRTGKPCVYLERPSVSLLRKHLAVPENQLLEEPIK